MLGVGGRERNAGVNCATGEGGFQQPDCNNGSRYNSISFWLE